MGALGFFPSAYWALSSNKAELSPSIYSESSKCISLRLIRVGSF